MQKSIIKSFADIAKGDPAFSTIYIKDWSQVGFTYNGNYYNIYFIYVKGLRYVISQWQGPLQVSKDYNKNTSPDKIASDIYKNIIKS